MACPEIDIYFRVDITFKALLASTEDQTKTLSFIDRPYPEASEQYIAALTDLSGLGIGVGQSGMPVQSVGSVILSDLPDSLGLERRVSDLLAWYTVANQPIVIYASQVAIGGAPSFEQVWSGTGVNASKSGGVEESISIQCKGVSIPVRPVLRAIQEIEINSMVQNSIGRFPALPIGSAPTQIYGNAWPCIAYPVVSTIGGDAFTTYATRLVATKGPTTPRVFDYGWARCFDGKYRLVYAGDGSFTELWDTNTASTNAPTYYGGTEICIPLKIVSTSERYIITGGRFWFEGQNSGLITPTGDLIFKLYLSRDSSGNDRPDNAHVAIATVDKADYLSDVQGSADFHVEFTFIEPFVFGGAAPGADDLSWLYLGLTVTNYSGNQLTDFVPGKVLGTDTYYYRDTNGEWKGDGTYKPRCALYALAWTAYDYEPDSYSEDGIAYKAVDLGQKDPGAGQEASNLNGLDLLIGVQGGLDTSGGEFTGTANQMVERPEHVLKMLSYKWVSPSWVSDATYDWTIYSSAHNEVYAGSYPRLVAGTITQDSTTEDIMSVIAGEHRYNIIQDPLGVITATPAGYEADVSVVIDSEESIVTGWNILNPETAVNNVKMFYAANILNSQNSSELSSNGFEAYANSYDFATDLPVIHSIGAQSQALFGKRELGQQAFNLVADSITAQAIGNLTYRQFDLPHWIVNLSIPFWKYRTLRLMDIIEITSPALPAYFGTSEEGHRPIYDGDPVEAAYGEYPKRAQRYRCQIIQKNLEYQAGTIPRWDLTVRIISPYHPNEVT